MPGIADDQRHVQRQLVHAVVVEVAFVIVKRFAVVAVDDDDGVIRQSLGFQRREDGLDGGVHVGDRAVVLGDDIILVGDAGRHPTGEEVAERLEGHDRIHRIVAAVGFVAVIKRALKRRGRQIRARAGPCGAGRGRRGRAVWRAGPVRGGPPR